MFSSAAVVCPSRTKATDSKLNVENVVKPPSTPTNMNSRASGLKSDRLSASPPSTPISRQPATLTTPVPQANPGSASSAARPAPDGMSRGTTPPSGTVRVGRAVERGAGTWVERGKCSQTVIGDGTKIDNLCQIGHNCRIGRCVIIAGMTALGGSVVIEDGAQIGGHAVIKEHCKVGAGAQLAGSSGLMHDIPPGEQWFGTPARKATTAFREFAALRKLPDALREKTLRPDDS